MSRRLASRRRRLRWFFWRCSLCQSFGRQQHETPYLTEQATAPTNAHSRHVPNLLFCHCSSRDRTAF